MSDVIVVVFILIVVALVAFAFGGSSAKYEIRKEAVAAGVGGFVLTDPTIGTTKFVWITNK